MEPSEMDFTELIEEIRGDLQRGRFSSEAAVSQGILLRCLAALGWPVFNTSIVVPEFSVEKRRVDFALCHPEDKAAVFVEVKKVGATDGADRQLFEYAFHQGVPMAILTDGREWSFYLPGEQGRYDERRVYKLDLLERDAAEAVDRLERYLGYEAVCSGAALEAARSDYRNVSRNRIIERTLPDAWAALLHDRDSGLADLLAEKTEDICGYRPDVDSCVRFLQNRNPGILLRDGGLETPKARPAAPVAVPQTPQAKPQAKPRAGAASRCFSKAGKSPSARRGT